MSDGPAVNGDITDQLNHAVRLREAVPGDPTAGPYPATVDEVADEVVAWLGEMDRTAGRGVAYAVLIRLSDAFADPGPDPAHADALRHSHDPV